MSEMEGVSYAVFAVYVLTSAGLTAAARKLGGSQVRGDCSRIETTAHVAALIGLAGSGLWPLLRAAFGEPLHPDPIQTALDGLAGDLAGHLLLVLGALLAIAAQMHGDAARRKEPSRPFVDSGPFAISRHPVTLGRIVSAVGLFLVFPGIAQGALTLAVIAASAIGARLEEQRLSGEADADYVAYLRRVPRWLGFPRDEAD